MIFGLNKESTINQVCEHIMSYFSSNNDFTTKVEITHSIVSDYFRNIYYQNVDVSYSKLKYRCITIIHNNLLYECTNLTMLFSTLEELDLKFKIKSIIDGHP